MWFSKELKLGLEIVSDYLFIFSWKHLDDSISQKLVI